MSCLLVSITHTRPAEIAVAAVAAAAVSVTAAARAETSVEAAPVAVARCQVQPTAAVSITGIGRPVVTISEVCAIGGGELCVLAASDGILRTRDGGFFLLDPAREDEE